MSQRCTLTYRESQPVPHHNLCRDHGHRIRCCQAHANLTQCYKPRGFSPIHTLAITSMEVFIMFCKGPQITSGSLAYTDDISFGKFLSREVTQKCQSPPLLEHILKCFSNLSNYSVLVNYTYQNLLSITCAGHWAEKTGPASSWTNEALKILSAYIFCQKIIHLHI